MVKWLCGVIKLVGSISLWRLESAFLLLLGNWIWWQLVHHLSVLRPVSTRSLPLPLLFFLWIKELLGFTNNGWFGLCPYCVDIGRVGYVIDLLVVQWPSFDWKLDTPATSLCPGSPLFLLWKMYWLSKQISSKRRFLYRMAINLRHLQFRRKLNRPCCSGKQCRDQWGQHCCVAESSISTEFLLGSTPGWLNVAPLGTPWSVLSVCWTSSWWCSLDVINGINAITSELYRLN